MNSYTRRQVRSGLLIFILLLIAIGVAADAIPGPFSGTVSGSLDFQPGVSFPFNYGMEWTGYALIADVQINFIAASGVTQDELDAARPTWTSTIQSLWSGRYEIIKDGTYHFPVNVAVTTSGPIFNYDVTVYPSTDTNPTTATYWHISDTGTVAAHEFGHLVGLWDEYTGGWTDPSGLYPSFPAFSTDSIMNSTNADAHPYSRHYSQFVAWMQQHDPDETWTMVPEPASLVLVGAGLAAVFVSRSKRHGRRGEQSKA